MPPNLPQTKLDPLDTLVRQYLTKDGVLHSDAHEVVTRWYNYLHTLTHTLGNQIRPMPAIGTDAVELAFETPVAGFQGNVFWQQYGHTILPLVQHDLVTQHTLLSLSQAKPDLLLALNIIGTHTYIGFIVSLVQRDGLTSWKAFEQAFRQLMEQTALEWLNGNTIHN